MQKQNTIKWLNVVLDNEQIPQEIKEKIQKDYLISNNGDVKNIKTNKILKGTITKSGYRRVDLSYKKYRYSFLVHRLVLLAFGDTPKNETVHHIDRNKLNNNISNLQWISRKEHGKISNIKECI